MLVYSFNVVYATKSYSRLQTRLGLPQTLQNSAISLLFAAWGWALQVLHLVAFVVYTSGSAQGLCGLLSSVVLGCHQSCWSRWPALTLCPYVSCSRSWAQLAHFPLSDPLLVPPAGHHAQVCLQEGAVLLLCAMPKPSSSPRTQTDRGAKWSTH